MDDHQHADLTERIRELVKDATTLLDHAREAESHHASGDLGALARVIGVIHYPQAHVHDDVAGIHRALAQLGVKPA